MLSRGDQDAFFHQAGRVTDASDVSADRLDRKAIEINAAKNNPAAGSCGNDLQVDRSAAVQAKTVTLDGCSDCLFLNQGPGGYLSLHD
jgi:hypothetical protein